MSEVKKLVFDIKNCSSKLIDQPGFLAPDYSELAKLCKEFLLDLGYKVVNPINYRFKAKKIEDLFNLFYDRLNYYHPDMTGTYRNLDRDRKIASKFVEARMAASDISKEFALRECAEIILTVFEHESEFNFNLPLTFEMFGQASCGWITDKAVQIMNKEKEAKDRSMVDRLIDEYNKKYIEERGVESIALFNFKEEEEDGEEEKRST